MNGSAALPNAARVAARELLAAARPVVLLGPEAEPAVQPLLRLAEQLGAALLTTPDAKSLVDHWHSCGTFSFGASASARRIVERADAILAVSALGEFSSRLGEAFKGKRLVQVAITIAHVGRNAEVTVALVGGSIANSVDSLCAVLSGQLKNPKARWFDELLSDPSAAPEQTAAPGFVHPAAVVAAIEAALPETARVCLDVTSGALHAYERLRVTRQQRVFSSVENSACMAEALLASIGIRTASGVPTLALVGDSGFCMAPAELHTAVELALGQYIVVILANSGGALIGAGVRQQGIAVPESAWRWREPPSFAQVARGYGARAVTVDTAEELRSELERAFRESGPVVIEVKVDPSAPVPAGDRFLTLGEAQR